MVVTVLKKQENIISWKVLCLPDDATRKNILKRFIAGLSSFTFENASELHPKVCSICDRTPRIDNFGEFVDIDLFVQLCRKNNLEKSNVKDFYGSLSHQGRN